MLVIIDLEPGAKGSVEVVEVEDLAGSDFRFQLHLQGYIALQK
jgi:hypothetical protein